MRLKISIYTRLVFWITLLVVLLFGAVLFVIQIREAKILQDESETRALLQARYVADANLQSLLHQDSPAIQAYVDTHCTGDLVYIVVYDRQGQPAAWNALIRDHGDLVSTSHRPSLSPGTGLTVAGTGRARWRIRTSAANPSPAVGSSATFGTTAGGPPSMNDTSSTTTRVVSRSSRRAIVIVFERTSTRLT